MPAENERNAEELIQTVHALHREISAKQREQFRVIAQIDRLELWRDSGARDMAHWVWMHFGISDWKARRWIASSHALESLPEIAEAFASGELGIDKVVELTRFATAETETDLIPWAENVSCGAIRHKGDLEIRRSLQDSIIDEQARFLRWWYFDEGSRFGIEGELPSAQGALVARALERLAESLPLMPGEEGPYGRDARMADALVTLCSARIGEDPDPDRATVIVHASLDSLVGSAGGCEIEGDGVISPQTARRLACNSRIQMVIEDGSGQPVRLGRIMRDPPAWMMRQLKHRDRECRFPGCGSRRFTHAHHIRWWEKGGTTDLDNLVLICSFHHRLVHEYGWRLKREPDGTVEWFFPDGTRYRAGPAPPREEEPERELVLSASGF